MVNRAHHGEARNHSRTAPKVLIFYHQPEEVVSRLSERVPGAEFSVCRSYRDLPAALANIRPEIILAYKFELGPFPREQMLSSHGLRWLSIAFLGVEHLCPCDDEKLVETNAAGVAAKEMGHYALGAILGMFREFRGFLADQRAKRQAAEALG